MPVGNVYCEAKERLNLHLLHKRLSSLTEKTKLKAHEGEPGQLSVYDKDIALKQPSVKCKICGTPGQVP